MSKQRKFNARRFFDGFLGHEDELAALFTHHDKTLPEPFTTEAAAKAASKNLGSSDPMTILFYQIDDLATPKGRDIILSTAKSFEIEKDVPGADVTNQRVAMWLWRKDKAAFESAMDRLAASGIQGGQIALFPGKSASIIEDDAAAITGFVKQLNANIELWKGAERFTIHHYRDGKTLVILVFCERTAEVNWEMDPGSSVVKTRIGRPVIQDVLFYDESTGELEIEASHSKHREVLRNSFAVGVMDDNSFFPMEEHTRVLNLGKLIELDFNLLVRAGHTAKITSITLSQLIERKSFTATLSANGKDVVKILNAKNAAGLLNNTLIKSVRIELTLGAGRINRKSIELSGDNRIKFNRASHADEVYRYLRHWNLMETGAVEDHNAA